MTVTNPFRRQAAPMLAADADPVAASGRDLRDAYERGRRDTLRARKRHPMGMTFLFLAAAVGIAVAGYAAYSGSFGRGGQRLDRDLAAAAEQSKPMAREAAHDAGQALKGAGESLTRETPAPAPH